MEVVRRQDNGGSSHPLWEIKKSGHLSKMHKFMKWKPRSTKLVAFYKEVTCSVDEGRAMDVYLDSSKALGNLSHHCFLQDRLRNYGLDKWTTVSWMESWLNCQAHRAVSKLLLDLMKIYIHCTHMIYNKYIYYTYICRHRKSCPTIFPVQKQTSIWEKVKLAPGKPNWCIMGGWQNKF